MRRAAVLAVALLTNIPAGAQVHARLVPIYCTQCAVSTGHSQNWPGRSASPASPTLAVRAQALRSAPPGLQAGLAGPERTLPSPAAHSLAGPAPACLLDTSALDASASTHLPTQEAPQSPTASQEAPQSPTACKIGGIGAQSSMPSRARPRQHQQGPGASQGPAGARGHGNQKRSCLHAGAPCQRWATWSSSA